MNRINNEYVEKYLDRLANYSGDGVMKQMEEIAKQKQLPIIRKTVAGFVDILVRISGVKKVLEIGTSIGYSTMVFLNAMGEGGKVFTIEMDEELANIAKENFKQAGVLDSVTIFYGDAAEILHYMDGEFDMIFMDGPKAQYLNYLPHFLRLLKKGGLLVCDDVLFYGMVASDRLIHRRKITIVKRMRNFLNIISAHPNLDTSIIPLGDGLSISYKKE